jgi:hypothetical protein
MTDGARENGVVSQEIAAAAAKCAPAVEQKQLTVARRNLANSGRELGALEKNKGLRKLTRSTSQKRKQGHARHHRLSIGRYSRTSYCFASSNLFLNPTIGRSR